MLVFNKYLKELGYKKSDFSKKRGDERYSLDKEYGVVEAQTWNLYNTIILELYTYLRCFQENCIKGIPAPFIDESKDDHGASDFQKVVQEMIDGLRAYHELEHLEYSAFSSDEEYLAEYERLNDRFLKGWQLLGEHLGCLWW